MEHFTEGSFLIPRFIPCISSLKITQCAFVCVCVCVCVYIYIYIYINHMFAYSSIDECCFTVERCEYYDLPSGGGHVASVLDSIGSYGASPEKRIGVIYIDIDMFVNYNWVVTQ